MRFILPKEKHEMNALVDSREMWSEFVLEFLSLMVLIKTFQFLSWECRPTDVGTWDSRFALRKEINESLEAELKESDKRRFN